MNGAVNGVFSIPNDDNVFQFSNLNQPCKFCTQQLSQVTQDPMSHWCDCSEK